MKIKLIAFLLFFNCINAFASEVDTLMVESKSMNKFIPNIVILPDNYTTQQNGFSVVYLLHGAGGDYTDWLTKAPELRAYADTYNMIIVCPDGGSTSWYLDSPVDPNIKYETYISKELIDNIDKKYNTLKKSSARAITGLSMGGHGAFYLSFRHQDIWGAAGSMSGGLDFRPFPNNWDLHKRLGNYSEHKNNWEENTVMNMVYLLKGDNLKLILDCGFDDFFYDGNKRFHEKLLERNIPHDYIERPGKHNWNYWPNSLKYQLLFFNDFFESSNSD
ncbi:alpha/beta hydrolase [Gelidibacter salicanalis]|uniref:Esterase family protein n=1 Tax=Gelidibacter salicanalis TaxID=291193 RepID=A0A934KQJ0_9FLAO|nr:alpha/beta hydrolase family protein [Gelidibacter salicanalis]MBJ7881989.1 esterase family protein [Gelidibacter salicanalis]